MNNTARIALAGFLAVSLFACKSKDKSDKQSDEQADKTADKTADTATKPADTKPADDKPDDTKPADDKRPAGADEFDGFAKDVLAALGQKDSGALYALALHGEDVDSLMAMVKEKCPDKLPASVDPDVAATEMKKMLGTDGERVKEYANYHAECAKLGDWSKATFKTAVASEASLECGGGNADNVVVEALIADKPVFIHLDDPIKTADGWRLPESITCSTEDPAK